ncbi:MAG TPA: hypothetical protein VJP86_06905 [Vicinamibacterales bacterium]|nr:hypothetical protein [Vicinamibacterales bacterium]
MRRAPAAAILLTSCLIAAAQAAAANVTVSLRNGLVSIHATQAPLSEIIAEWSRVGGTVFVNTNIVPATPTTLELTDVPEKDALAILLRDTTGYLAVGRSTADAGLSQLARVVIMPGRTMTTAERATQAAALPPPRQPAPAPFDPNTVAPVIAPNGAPVQDDQLGAPPFVPTQRPYGDPASAPSASPNARPFQPGQPATPPVPYGAPPAGSNTAAPTGSTPVGSPAPGMIAPPPTPAVPGAPAPPPPQNQR